LGSIGTHGYGILGRKLAHREAHEEFNGPIPEGYQVDHLCRVRTCVSPAHLEAVTQQENLLRQGLAQPTRNPTGYRGVTRNGKGWLARLKRRGKDIYLGTYPTPEEAHQARESHLRANP
jgi:hypothetical protein